MIESQARLLGQDGLDRLPAHPVRVVYGQVLPTMVDRLRCVR